MVKLGARDLRTTKPTEEELKSRKHQPIYLVLDEVIDTYNIGSLFRLADAIGATKVFLCGNMEYPPSSRVHRAAIGTEEWVPWEKKETTMQAIEELKGKRVSIIAVEQDERSVSYKDLKPNFPVAIVVGNETNGVKKEILDMADVIVELPMLGVNKSFNVWGSAAVIAYKILENL